MYLCKCWTMNSGIEKTTDKAAEMRAYAKQLNILERHSKHTEALKNIVWSMPNIPHNEHQQTTARIQIPLYIQEG